MTSHPLLPLPPIPLGYNRQPSTIFNISIIQIYWKFSFLEAILYRTFVIIALAISYIFWQSALHTERHRRVLIGMPLGLILVWRCLKWQKLKLSRTALLETNAGIIPEEMIELKQEGELKKWQLKNDQPKYWCCSFILCECGCGWEPAATLLRKSLIFLFRWAQG